MALAGISTLGILFGYADEETAGTRPTSGYTLLTRINQIGGLAVSSEAIDASALEDSVSRYVAGRADIGGGTINITVNATDATVTEWETLITAYQALTGGKRMWFEAYSPKLTKGFFFAAQPPSKLPMPEMSQNGLLTMEIPLVVEEYVGLETAVVPTA